MPRGNPAQSRCISQEQHRSHPLESTQGSRARGAHRAPGWEGRSHSRRRPACQRRPRCQRARLSRHPSLGCLHSTTAQNACSMLPGRPGTFRHAPLLSWVQAPLGKHLYQHCFGWRRACNALHSYHLSNYSCGTTERSTEQKTNMRTAQARVAVAAREPAGLAAAARAALGVAPHAAAQAPAPLMPVAAQRLHTMPPLVCRNPISKQRAKEGHAQRRSASPHGLDRAHECSQTSSARQGRAGLPWQLGWDARCAL